MRSKFFDLLAEKSDLIFRRTGIFFVPFDFLSDFFLLLVRESHVVRRNARFPLKDKPTLAIYCLQKISYHGKIDLSRNLRYILFRPFNFRKRARAVEWTAFEMRRRRNLSGGTPRTKIEFKILLNKESCQSG